MLSDKRKKNNQINLIILLIFSFVFVTSNAVAIEKSKTIVNILTWWGYIDDKKIEQQIENECHVKISYDEYYSSNEFLRRWSNQKNNYDVIIFSNTLYKLLKNDIKIKQSSLRKQSEHYNNIIKNHYRASHYLPNVVYFLHSLSGFLWNPDVVTLNSKDTLESIFNKTKTNTVVLLDDSIEASMLVSLNNAHDSLTKPKSPLANVQSNSLSIDAFNKLTKNNTVYITNDYSRIYLKSDFAFSYAWSGEAINDLKGSGKNYKFLVHPHLSYVSTDLLAELNTKPEVHCVAKMLSSRSTLSQLQNKTFYFSPYANREEVTDPFFKSIYSTFLNGLPSYAWIEPLEPQEINDISRTWELIKINIKNRTLSANA